MRPPDGSSDSSLLVEVEPRSGRPTAWRALPARSGVHVQSDFIEDCRQDRFKAEMARSELAMEVQLLKDLLADIRVFRNRLF